MPNPQGCLMDNTDGRNDTPPRHNEMLNVAWLNGHVKSDKIITSA